MSSTSETESSDDESAVKRQRLLEACAPGWSTVSGKSGVKATSSRTSTAKIEVDDPDRLHVPSGLRNAAASRLGELIDAQYKYRKKDHSREEVKEECAGINLLAGARVELKEESDEKLTARPPILFPAVKVDDRKQAIEASVVGRTDLEKQKKMRWRDSKSNSQVLRDVVVRPT